MTNFNPRSPCGERRLFPILRQQRPAFQSTLPVWGATADNLSLAPKIRISIHAPRVGSDPYCDISYMLNQLFQSTLPVWGATWLRAGFRFLQHHFNPRSPCGERPLIPPHPRFPPGFQSTLPVWGATRRCLCHCTMRKNFNPRSPCGERHATTTGTTAARPFQSTLPVWGATV